MNLYIHDNVKLCLPLSNIINKYLDPTLILWKYFKPVEFRGEFRTIGDIYLYLHERYENITFIDYGKENNKGIVTLKLKNERNEYSCEYIDHQIECINNRVI